MLSRHFRKRVVTIREDASVAEAAERMAEEAVGALPVVDGEGRLVGLLTDRDLVVRVVAPMVGGPAGSPERARETRVSEVMTTEPVALEIGAPTAEMVRAVRERGVRRIPVLEDGKPVGLVAADDLLNELAHAAVDLAEAPLDRYEASRRDARYERVRAGVERRLEDITHRLEFASWHAQRALLEKIDALRARVRHAIAGDDEPPAPAP